MRRICRFRPSISTTSYQGFAACSTNWMEAGEGLTLCQSCSVVRTGVRPPAYFHEMGFRNVRAGLGEFLRQCSVVGHQEEAFAGVVEPADRIEACGDPLDEIHHGGTAFGVG